MGSLTWIRCTYWYFRGGEGPRPTLMVVNALAETRDSVPFSHAQDRRNAHNANDKASRKAISFHKRHVNKTNRHVDGQTLHVAEGRRDESIVRMSTTAFMDVDRNDGRCGPTRALAHA